MNYIEYINEKKDFSNFNIQRITTQEAKDRNMFGVVYHGTTVENWEEIKKHGFKIEYNTPSNSYYQIPYYQQIYPPIHHLGYGIYFTTKKAIAMNYNRGTSKNLYQFYLDVPNLCTINFGIPKTMMNWWLENGYENITNEEYYMYDGDKNPTTTKRRVEATKKMTDVLKSKYDAVWYKGQGFAGKLLDGDQICVYDTAKIYLLDDSNVKGLVIGGKVERTNDEFHVKFSYDADGNMKRVVTDDIKIPKGMTGIITNVRTNLNGIKIYTVKWKKGGTEYNNYETDIKSI